jgi:hypothetical protein
MNEIKYGIIPFNPGVVQIPPPPPPNFLLQEDGFFILQENGSEIALET